MLKRTTSRKLTPLPTLMVPTNMSYEKEALSLLYVENRPLSDFSVFTLFQEFVYKYAVKTSEITFNHSKGDYIEN